MTAGRATAASIMEELAVLLWGRNGASVGGFWPLAAAAEASAMVLLLVRGVRLGGDGAIPSFQWWGQGGR